MPDLVTVQAVPPIAGIPIEHHVAAEIQLRPSYEGAWAGTARRGEPVVIHHAVGDIGVDGLREVFRIEHVATHFDDGSGGTTIKYLRQDPGVPEYVLRTVRPGYEYSVSYEFAPDFSLPRRDKEMNAYAISLAARGAGLIGHGAGFVLPSGVAALCLGISGAGKSTLAKMMLTRPGVAVLNDDRLVITREPEPGGLHLWSTPWPGRAGIAYDGHAPLGAIALIGRADTPRVRPVGPAAALRTLLATIALPLWGEQVHDGLALIEEMVETVPVVELAYPLGEETPARLVELLLGVTR